MLPTDAQPPPHLAGPLHQDGLRDSSDLRQRADTAGKSAIAEADLSALPTALRRWDAAALLKMVATVHKLDGLPPGAVRTAAQVAEAMGTAVRHRWIVRYWLEIFAAEGLLVRGGDGRYQNLREITQEENAAADTALDAAASALGYPAVVIRFFQVVNENLPGLLRDDILPQALFFPGGEITIALGTYEDNTVNRYLNAATAEVVHQAALARADPLRVLELGAGVGATTASVLVSLAGRKVDYLFTDISRFFLNTARERFGEYPGLRYALVDINGELPGQGVSTGKTDVVIAANVVHNAHHVGRAMTNLRRLLTPDGLLVIMEVCRESYQLMAFILFLLSPQPGKPVTGFTDSRAGSDRILFTRQEWLAQLQDVGLRPLFDLPYPDDEPLTAFAQHLFVATPTIFDRSK